MAVDHEVGRANSQGMRIFYRRLGTAGSTPLVFVHGLSYFSYDWLGPAQALATDREAACMDMRGFGDSGRSDDSDYSVPTMARDIVSLLDHLGWDRAVLFGHSMGGRSATYAAAYYPERVAGLVLVDYSPENARAGARRVAATVANVPTRFASINEAMAYFGIEPGSQEVSSCRQRFEAYLQSEAGGFTLKRDPYFQRQFQLLLETGKRPSLGVDMWQVLGEVRCPTIVLRGKRSDMFAAETVTKVRAANARLRVIEVDAGHDIAGDNPSDFLRATRSFLANIGDD